MNSISLSQDQIDKISLLKYDSIVEKHEGPWSWANAFAFDDPALLYAGDYLVLLPISRNHHRNVTILRTIGSADGESLTLFFKDTTFVESRENDFFSAGFVAICEKVAGESFYVAVVYHAWFLLDDQFPGNS